MKNCSNGPPRATRFTKSRRGPVRRGGRSHLARRVGPGPVPGGIRPLRPHEGIRCTPRIPGRKTGFQSGTVVDRLAREGPVDATASNLDTHLDRGVGRRVRMLLSFQRPSHLFGKGIPPRGASETVPISERTGEYSARIATWGAAARRTARAHPRAMPRRTRRRRRRHVRGPRARRCGPGRRTPQNRTCTLPRPQDRTWTVTVRRRGRSSKSIRTTCCQVPSWRRPSTIGTVSDGPMTAARRWAWEFVSWLRRLCS